MKILSAAVLAALSTISATAGAVDFEAGLGYTHYGHQGNGVWYQQGFPYDLSMNAPAFNIGVRGKVNDMWSWRAGYLDLGRAKVDSQILGDDALYDANLPPTYCTESPCRPLSRLHGSGKVRGLYATVNPQFQFWGINWVGEAGLIMYRPSWVVDVPVRYTDNGTPPSSDSVRLERKAKWQAGVTLGIGVRFMDSFTLMLNRYTCDAKAGAAEDEIPAIYHGGATVMSLRYDF